MESDNDKTQSFLVLAKGTEVGHYKIIDKIGAGGMGEVYLAEDTKLKRNVALKFLPSHLCQDEDCRARFIREARAAAKLNHPNIVTIYEVSEFKGRPFLAMEHVKGETLKAVIKKNKLSVGNAIKYTGQICEGLHKAHESGIIHRDIKPGNIIIDGDGRAKILDFGLAMVVGEDKLTKTGSTLGTVGYMSPEQIEGKTVDHRSDLFSVGVILYEMITGRRPFEGDNEAAVVKAITSSSPEPIARFKSGTTVELQSVIDKALSKDVSTRYQHADGMLADLKRLKSETLRKEKSNKIWWIAAVTVLIAIVGYFIIDGFLLRKKATREGWTNSIAVLIFRDQSPERDQDYFCEGMTDAIIGRLSNIKELKVISLTSVLKVKDTDKNIKEIGKILDVKNILEGSIVKDGDRIRVRAQLIDVNEDAHIWSDQFDQRLESVFDVQDDISAAVVEALKIELIDVEGSSLVKHNTENLEAYNEYTQGRYFWRKRTGEGIRKSIKHFKRAIELDSSYALAYSGLADAWSILESYGGVTGNFPEYYQNAREAALKAVELDDNLAEAHASLGLVYYQDRDIENSQKEFLKAIELNPGYPWTHIWYGNLLAEWLRDSVGAIEEYELALDNDPLSITALHNLGHFKSLAGDYNAADSLFIKMLDIEPSNVNYRIDVANHYLRSGDTIKAIDQYKEAIALQPTYWGQYYNLASIYLYNNRPDEAEQVWFDAIAKYPDQPELFNRYGVFLQYELKRSDDAIAWIKKAIELDSTYSTSYYYLARTYRDIGDYEKAIWAGRKGIEIDPEDPYHLRLLGEIYYKAGKLDSSINSYLAYLSHEPGDVVNINNAGNIAILNRQYNLADSLLDVIANHSVTGQRAWGRFLKPRILDHQGKFNKALEEYEEYIKIDYDEVEKDFNYMAKYYNRGVILLLLGKTDSALVQFRIARDMLWEIDSTHNWMIAMDGRIALAYASQGKPAKALKIMESIPHKMDTTIKGNLGTYCRYMAMVQSALGNIDSAILYAGRRLEIGGQSFINLMLCGKIYLRANRFNEAIVAFEKAILIYDNTRRSYPHRAVLIHYQLGQAYEAAGRNDDAIKQHETFLDIWKNADEGLESVEDAKVRLARLKNET